MDTYALFVHGKLAQTVNVETDEVGWFYLRACIWQELLRQGLAARIGNWYKEDSGEPGERKYIFSRSHAEHFIDLCQSVEPVDRSKDCRQERLGSIRFYRSAFEQWIEGMKAGVLSSCQ